VPPEIQDRDLAHLAADAFAPHQAVREVGLASGGIVGSSSSYKHPLILQEKQGVKSCHAKYYGTTKRFSKYRH